MTPRIIATGLWLSPLLACWLCLQAGCGGASADAKRTAAKSNSGGKKQEKDSRQGQRPEPNRNETRLGGPDSESTPAPSRPGNKKPSSRLPEGPQLADLVTQAGAEGERVEFDKAAIPVPAHRPIDEEKAAALGIRKVPGKVLTLYTDLPAEPEVEELPLVFEKAVPQWCAYFGLDQGKAANWRPRAFLMKDKQKFLDSGLLPTDLPPFLHGFQRESDLFLYEQPSTFYRRHLLLHEGTHGFMNVLLGGAGPPWFMEGTAEMLGTHLWKDGQLTLGYIPQTREDAPWWGRVKIIKDETAAGRALTLQEIFNYDVQAHLRAEPYGWCWGACSFLDRHPLTQEAFRGMRRELRDTSPRFSAVFHERVKADWPKIIEQWQLFVLEQEYGYDVERAAVLYRTGEPLSAANQTAAIAADRGWQSSGIRLEAGNVYQLAAEGRYQIGKTPKIWWCEPGGVTVHYHRGRPLGMLLAAVRADEGPGQGLSPLVKPIAVGLAANLAPEISGTLYLKINESAADLGDNEGSLTVRVGAK